jgi:hypothetical protein
MDQIIKDRNGRPQGIIRQMAGGREELLNTGGNPLAFYDPKRDATYTPGGTKVGSGNRLMSFLPK